MAPVEDPKHHAPYSLVEDEVEWGTVEMEMHWNLEKHLNDFNEIAKTLLSKTLLLNAKISL